MPTAGYTDTMTQNAYCDPPAGAPQHGCDGPPADWLVPDWPAPAHVHALCTTRAGGVSIGAYASMNLGRHAGDAPQAVQANHQRLAAALRSITRSAHPVFLKQVHGSDCVQLRADTVDGDATYGAAADAAVTSQPSLVCAIMLADCLPVLLTDPHGRAVGAAHAGWRGLAGGVLENFVEHFSPLAHADRALEATETIAKSRRAEWLAWLGPCIGPRAFEVGAEVHAAFCAADAPADAHFRPHGEGKFLADLAGLARRRLARLGITQVYGNDSSDAWCTVQQSSRFFSHRRDGGVFAGAVGGTGRMAACIWLD